MKDEERSRISLILGDSSGESLRDDFEFLMRMSEQAGNEPMFATILEAFAALADRQWETYEVISDGLKRALSKTLILLWDKNSLDSTEKLIGIIGRLGLDEALSSLVNSASELSSADVKNAIYLAVDEFGDNVSDPYSGMS